MKKYFKSLMSGLMALCLTGIILSCSNAADGASDGSSGKKPATYTVTFNANDGSAQPATATQTFTEGKAQTLKTITELGFSKTGHNFAGWGLTADAAQSSYADGGTYTATSAVTFYALWSLIPVKKYHVDVSCENGVAYAEPENAPAGTEITIYYQAENGYEIAHISGEDENNNSITIANEKFIMPSCDVRVDILFEFTGIYSATLTNLKDVISQLKSEATIVLTGEVKETDFNAIRTAIFYSKKNIILDMSKVTGLTKIPQASFLGCEKLAGFLFPATIETIEAEAFDGCTGLKSIKIPYGITSIGVRTFCGCRNLNSVVIPNSVTTISGEAFYECWSLEAIEIPSSVTTIKCFAFRECTDLKSVTIPSSVTTIEEAPFVHCTNLLNIEVDDNNNNFTSVNGVLLSKDKKKLIQYPGGIEGKYVMPDTVTSIEQSAFAWCVKLSEIEITNSVTSIGGRAFEYCTGLESITISNNVTCIWLETFSCCMALKSIEIPNSVTFIDSNVFEYCDSLESIKFNDLNFWYYGSDMNSYYKKIDLSDASQNVEYLVNGDYSNYCLNKRAY